MVWATVTDFLPDFQRWIEFQFGLGNLQQNPTANCYEEIGFTGRFVRCSISYPDPIIGGYFLDSSVNPGPNKGVMLRIDNNRKRQVEGHIEGEVIPMFLGQDTYSFPTENTDRLLRDMQRGRKLHSLSYRTNKPFRTFSLTGFSQGFEILRAHCNGS